jgi:hypothetical protein
MNRDFQTAPRGLPSLTAPGRRVGRLALFTFPAVLTAFFAAALAVATLSCATIGHRFPPENVARVKIGQTTKAQLLGDFGLPYRRGIEDGDSTWTYVYYKFRLFGENLRTRDLYLRFDPDGRVKSYTYNSNLDD